MNVLTKKIDLVINDNYGLHSRKCAEIVRAASNFISNIKLIHDKNSVDIKSILGLMSLSVVQGQKVTIEADGTDADSAIESLSKIVK